MSSWVRVGAKCVFVGGMKSNPLPGSSFSPNMIRPIKGKVYEVTSSHVCPAYGAVRICVTGAPNPDAFGVDHGWNVDQFRPLIQKTQSEDIEMFLRIAPKAPSNMEITDAWASVRRENMSEKDNGGTAFPLHPGIEPSWKESRGMSLRDWFAGQALNGMMSDPDEVPDEGEDMGKFYSDLAYTSYRLADAMLKERNK